MYSYHVYFFHIAIDLTSLLLELEIYTSFSWHYLQTIYIPIPLNTILFWNPTNLVQGKHSLNSCALKCGMIYFTLPSINILYTPLKHCSNSLLCSKYFHSWYLILTNLHIQMENFLLFFFFTVAVVFFFFTVL